MYLNEVIHLTPPSTYIFNLLIYYFFLDSFKFEKIVEGYPLLPNTQGKIRV